MSKFNYPHTDLLLLLLQQSKREGGKIFFKSVINVCIHRWEGEQSRTCVTYIKLNRLCKGKDFATISSQHFAEN